MDSDWLFETNSLLGRARSGDEQAVEALYARYIRRVESWTRGRLQNHARGIEDTHTVAHDVLVRSLIQATEGDQPIHTSFKAYVRRAVRNRLIDLNQSVWRDTEQISEDAAQEGPDELERILAREFEDRVSDGIDRLPRDAKQVLLLRFERGFGYREIAQLVGMSSEDAVRMKIKRTLDQLRADLEASG